MERSIATYLNWVKHRCVRSAWPTWPRTAIGAVARWRERVRQRRDLGLLDDADLRDIGVSRAEAERERKKWF